jgi:hypothetical protein
MNLLDPDYFIKPNKAQWFFVTIDTWMVKAFMNIAPSTDLNLNQIESITRQVFKSGANYFNSKQTMHKLANEVGVLPKDQDEFVNFALNLIIYNIIF